MEANDGNVHTTANDRHGRNNNGHMQDEVMVDIGNTLNQEKVVAREVGQKSTQAQLIPVGPAKSGGTVCLLKKAAREMGSQAHQKNTPSFVDKSVRSGGPRQIMKVGQVVSQKEGLAKKWEGKKGSFSSKPFSFSSYPLQPPLVTRIREWECAWLFAR